jgi:CheY-like chemotaxis protein
MRIQTIPSDAVDVLIVEHDSFTCQTLRRLLERRGYRCAEAQSGRQALALARAKPPRYVLLDLVLPDLDGLAVARRLRADVRTFGTHILGLTERQSQRVWQQAERAAIEAILLKPVDTQRLLEIIARERALNDERKAAVVWGLTKTQAEDVLDWMTNHGCTGFVVNKESAGFVVRCVCPSGFCLSRAEDGSLNLVRSGTGQDFFATTKNASTQRKKPNRGDYQCN